MPLGRRREQINKAINVAIEVDYDKRILNFDFNTGILYGGLCAKLRRNGNSVGQFDIMIASIALQQDAVVVTRSDKDFIPCMDKIINPFEEE